MFAFPVLGSKSSFSESDLPGTAVEEYLVWLGTDTITQTLQGQMYILWNDASLPEDAQKKSV